MTGEGTAQAQGQKSEKPDADGKKQRLAAALRRNLAKRKATKGPNSKNNSETA